jgi:hypothetical protein
MKSLQAEVSAGLREGIAEIRDSLIERDQALRYELDHNTHRLGTMIYAPCGCKAMVNGSYRMDGYQHFSCGEIEPCEQHAEVV